MRQRRQILKEFAYICNVKERHMKYICNIFHICANYIHSCSGDLFIDFPKAYEKYEKGENVYLTVRKTGADLLERFTECLAEQGKPCGMAESVEYGRKTLGIDFMVCILKGEPLVIHTYNIKDKWERRNLKTTFEQAFFGKEEVRMHEHEEE